MFAKPRKLWKLITGLAVGLFALSLYRGGVSGAPGQAEILNNEGKIPSQAAILWSANQETGNLSQWERGDGGGEYNSGIADSVAVKTMARSGSWSIKLTIRTPSNPTSGTRLFRWAEPRRRASLYYSAWYYFPGRLDIERKDGWLNVMQWKSSTARKNDPFWLIGVQNRADGSMYFDLYDWQNDESYQQAVMNIPVGRWTHLEAFYRIDTNRNNPKGRITVWQDGRRLFDINNVQTAYPYEWGGPNSWDVGWSVNNYGQDLTPSTWTYYIDDAVISTERIGEEVTSIYLPLILSEV